MQKDNQFVSARRPEIEGIVREKRLCVYFQPIVSTARQTVCGVEGLIRGINENGGLIAPPVLFEAAQECNVTLALDRLCRDSVLKAYAALHRFSPNKLLFINLDTSILSGAVSHYLFHQVCLYGIDPGNIVIEINESNIKEDEWLRGFIDEYRRLGFLIALDDIGSGFSSLNRIPLCKPDIIKIDIALVRNIDSDYHKQEVFKSLVGLSSRIGAVTVAEGIETAQEAVAAMRLGAHMLQGYYFSPPREAGGLDIFLNDKIASLGSFFKQHIRSIERQTRIKRRLIESIADHAVKHFAANGCADLNKRLLSIATLSPVIECAYVLDAHGTQLSGTIFSPNCNPRENRIFYSARGGDDHSMKPYYYRLKKSPRDRYITEPYVSLATGNLCITCTQFFSVSENTRLILCIDFIADMSI